MTAYGIYGPRSRELLTFGGRVLVHDDRAEMEFLFPGSCIREVPPSIPADQRFPVRLHPQLAHVEFPLTRKAFR